MLPDLLVCYIPYTKQFADSIALPKVNATFGQFSDGEWHVTIHDSVQNKVVWVLGQTGAPPDCMFQLLLVCDALRRAGAIIKIFISYMGYARQDRAFDGQALSCQVMCKLFELCNAQEVHALQLHNPLICAQYFTNHIPYQFFNEQATEVDVIVAPDKGAAIWAGHIASAQFMQLICIEKNRPKPEQVVVNITGDVQGKRALIVDDMITTGNTILEAARILFERGAASVQVAATHGLFTGDAIKKLEDSKIEKIIVTNSLLQTQTSAKITLVDIAPYIADIIKG